MSVIVELQVPGEEFQLGRILQGREGGGHIEFETTVPTGGRALPFFWVYDGSTDEFESTVANHEMVEGLRTVDTFDDRTLYALDWRASEGDLLTAIAARDAQLLTASRSDELWDLELRFPTHESLSGFQNDAEAHDITISVQRLYNPTEPDTERSYGLSSAQREGLELAVRRGYYDIPRRVSTLELAEELGISDQAVTERLRRAIVTLVTNTLLSGDGDA